MYFKFGFYIESMKYGWCNKSLYRLPQSINGRYYPLKKLNPIIVGSSVGYTCYRKKFSLNQLKSLTQMFNEPIHINILKNKDLPF